MAVNDGRHGARPLETANGRTRSMAANNGRHGARIQTTARRRLGLTLMELMVSLAILSIAILAFSKVLQSMQKVVSESQARMRANAAAAAIADVLRDDVRRASQQGFLCLTEANTGSGGAREPQLIVSAAGTTHSLTGGQDGSGSVVAIGLCANNIVGGSNILYRCGWAINTDSTVPHYDCSHFISGLSGIFPGGKLYYFSDIELLNRPGCENFITALNASGNTNIPMPPGSLSAPPSSLGQINDLWKFLSEGCSNLEIAWTDGTIDPATNSLTWYTPANPKNTGMPPVAPEDASTTPPTPNTEYSSGGAYRALWTKENPQDWPKAIRFRFRLTAPGMPLQWDAAAGQMANFMEYEIICPVGG